jgi:hypothetical protein
LKWSAFSRHTRPSTRYVCGMERSVKTRCCVESPRWKSAEQWGAQGQSTLWIHSYAHLSCCLHNCWFTRHSSTGKCAPAHEVSRRSAASIGHFCHFRVSLRLSGGRVLCGVICLKRAPACFQSIRRTLTNDNKHLNSRSSREVRAKLSRSSREVRQAWIFRYCAACLNDSSSLVNR